MPKRQVKSQAFSHKFPLIEAKPPLARPSIALVVNPREKADCELLPDLGEVLLQLLGLLTVSRTFIHLWPGVDHEELAALHFMPAWRRYLHK